MDTTSEAWRHECEVRAVLLMPSDRRRGFIDLVAKRRGAEAGQQLRSDVYLAWVAGQADALVKMQWDEDRIDRLLRIQNSSNVRTRADVEREMNCRLAAKNNEREYEHE